MNNAAILAAAIALAGCGGDDRADEAQRANCQAKAKNTAEAAVIAKAYRRGDLTRKEVEAHFAPDDRIFDEQGRMVPSPRARGADASALQRVPGERAVPRTGPERAPGRRPQGSRSRLPGLLKARGGASSDARRSLARMDVELRQITSETVRSICELDVATDQRSFVAPNAVSIAEAHFTPGHWMRAIYADGQPVGFVLTFDDPSEGYFLWRFMIAEGHQRRGIGRRAMQQVLEHWRELGVTAARTSVVPSNIGATRLYESLGFRLTGEEDDGELVMSLDM